VLEGARFTTRGSFKSIYLASDAIRFDSAKHTGQGNNLVVFWDRLFSLPASYLEVYDPHKFITQRLPPT